MEDWIVQIRIDKDDVVAKAITNQSIGLVISENPVLISVILITIIL